MKYIIIICVLNILLFSCTANQYIQKNIENDGTGYILYKRKLPKGHYAYSQTNEYDINYLSKDYVLMMDSNKKGNLNNIYLYDGKNGIKYIIKNIKTFENIVHNIIPSEVIIYYYDFCTRGSGVENEDIVLIDINKILMDKNIKFAFGNENEYSKNYDPVYHRYRICTCLGG